MEQKAFKEMKKSLLQKQLFRIFDSNKSLRIETDTSDHTIAEVAMQEKQPIRFISHKMNKAEQNYTIMEKEMLTVIQIVKE